MLLLPAIPALTLPTIWLGHSKHDGMLLTDLEEGVDELVHPLLAPVLKVHRVAHLQGNKVDRV